MPQVNKLRENYYVYDYIYDVKKGKFKKIYVGKADERLFKKYKEEIAKKQVRDYCQKCGKRRKETLPEYYDAKDFDLCRCIG